MITEETFRGGSIEYEESPAFQLLGSKTVHVITGVAPVTFALLPDARASRSGRVYRIVNIGGDPITIRNVNGTETIGTVDGFKAANLGCLDDSSAEGEWALVELGFVSISDRVDVSDAIYALGEVNGAGLTMERYRPARGVWQNSIPPPFDSRSASLSRLLTGSKFGLLLSGGDGGQGTTREFNGTAWVTRTNLNKLSERQGGMQGDGGAHRVCGSDVDGHDRFEGETAGNGTWQTRAPAIEAAQVPAFSEIRDDKPTEAAVGTSSATGTVDPVQRARFGFNLSAHQPYEVSAGIYRKNLFTSVGGFYSEAGNPFSINLTDDGRPIDLDSTGVPQSLLADQKLTCSLWLDLGATWTKWSGPFPTLDFIDSAPLYPHVSNVSYIITWVGGEMDWIGFGDVQNLNRLSKNRWRFNVATASFTGIRLGITSIDPLEPPFGGTLAMFREDLELVIDAEPWDPAWTRDLELCGIARFMESNETNISDYSGSDTLDTSYIPWTTKRGWPVQKMIDLCNRFNVNPWYCAPTNTGSIHDRSELQRFKNQLDPGIVLWAEKSNEDWNFEFYSPTYQGNVHVFPAADHGNKHVWVSASQYTSPQVIPAFESGKKALDLRVHTSIDDVEAYKQAGYDRVGGIPTFNGLTMYEVGPNPVIPVPPGDVGPGYFALQVQGGVNSELFHEDVDQVFGSTSTRVVRVHGSQWANTGRILNGSANNPLGQTVAIAPYNPTIVRGCGSAPFDQYGQTWDLTNATACFAYMDAAHVGSVVPLTQAATQAIANTGKYASWYELGHQWLARSESVYPGQPLSAAQIDAINESSMQLLVEIMADARMGPQTKRLLDLVDQYAPGSTIAYYNDREKGTPGGGQYGFRRYSDQVIDEAPRWSSILEFLGYQEDGGGDVDDGSAANGFGTGLLTQTNGANDGRTALYTLATDSWIQGPPRPGGVAADGALSGAIDADGRGAAIFAGGTYSLTGSAKSPESWLLRRAITGIRYWKPQIPFIRPRNQAGAAYNATGGRVHIVGGDEGSGAIDVVESYRDGYWREETPKLSASTRMSNLVASCRKDP